MIFVFQKLVSGLTAADLNVISHFSLGFLFLFCFYNFCLCFLSYAVLLISLVMMSLYLSSMGLVGLLESVDSRYCLENSQILLLQILLLPCFLALFYFQDSNQNIRYTFSLHLLFFVCLILHFFPFLHFEFFLLLHVLFYYFLFSCDFSPVELFH